MTEARDTPPRSLDLIYGEAKERLAVQLAQVEALDAKAAAVFGLPNLVITVAAAIRFSGERTVASNAVFLPLFVIGAFLYVVTMYFAFTAYRVVRFRRDPEPRPLRDFYLDEDPLVTKRRLLSNLIDSYEFNASLLDRKAYNVRMAQRYLFLTTLMLAIALVAERTLA